MPTSDRPPTKVAYVIKRYPRFSETFIVNEILAHEAAGFEVHIFALRPPSDTHFQPAIGLVRGAVTYLMGDRVRADVLWTLLQQLSGDFDRIWHQLSEANLATGTEVYQAARLAQEITARGINHIHAHFGTTATAVARLSSIFTGVPYTFTAHAKDVFHETVIPQDLAQKIDDAAAVVTVSDFNAEYLSARFNGCADKIRRIYNGLDLDQFPFATPSLRPPRIMAVGRLVEKKGFRDLIDACAVLRDAGVDYRCEIVGGGELEPVLLARIDELSLGGMVQLSGPRPLSYVKEAIQSSAVLVVPSITASTGDREGLPMVLLESMALGTPCVATLVTGIPEAIRNCETGLLVPEHRPEELARAIQQLLADGNLGVRLASAARSLIEQQFEIHRNASELRRVFFANRQPKAAPLRLVEVR